MASRIISALNGSRKVLWLICGGSNIAGASDAMSMIRDEVLPHMLPNLTVGQTDERYGPVGHADSNWQQMKDNGFGFDDIKTLPILEDKPLAETVADYASKIGHAISATRENGGLIIAQFGMGADGHIAGMLPRSQAVNDTKLVSGYEGKPFTRISLTPTALRMIQVAYAFVFGATKARAVTDLRDKALPLEEEPAQILKQIPEASLASDSL